MTLNVLSKKQVPGGFRNSEIHGLIFQGYYFFSGISSVSALNMKRARESTFPERSPGTSM